MSSLTKKTFILALSTMGLNLAACGTEPYDDGLEPEDLDPIAVSGKAEAWDSANNPAYVDSTFLTYANQLPVSGEGPAPIPGSYWPVYQDNLNVKWDGSMSPAEKYAKAFGKNVKDIQDQVSMENGVKGHTERKACRTSSDCSDQMDGSECATSYDGTAKRCIPTWWGICHGWSPYAISEPQAKQAVTKNGVTFQPGDLEGLMSLVYTNVDTKFLSRRCNKGGTDIHTDNSGRVTETECRDMNPGAFHVLATNMLGLRKKGFVIDQTSTAEVWNQPVWKYRVTNAVGGALKAVSKDEAAAMLGGNLTMTSLMPSTTLKAQETKTGTWTATAATTAKFKLAGTGDADLYVKKGTSVSASSFDCNSTGGTAVEECAISVAAGDKVSWLVLGYSASSTANLGVGIPGHGTYSYNSAATKFWYVEMDFTFITESSPGTEAHNAADFASTKHYSYILEGDSYNKILGGEWVGDSLNDHPDFAWYPTAKPGAETAGIAYDDVKALNDDAAGPQGNNNLVTLLSSYKLPYTTYSRSKYVALTLEPGFTKVKVDMTGTGDASLFVGPKGKYPRIGWSANLCAERTAGTANESCTFNVSTTGGTYYVRAYSEKADTTVTVTATKIK